MDAPTIGTSWLAIANTAGLIILGILYVVKSSKSQVSEIDTQTIASLNRQIEAVSKEISSYKEQVHGLTLQIGEQNGIIKTQKETILKYEEIFKNRNPELTVVLGEIRDFMKAADERDQKVMKELQFQTGLIKKGEERSSKLDKAHGEVLKTT